jgi:hypothetical protein
MLVPHVSISPSPRVWNPNSPLMRIIDGLQRHSVTHRHTHRKHAGIQPRIFPGIARMYSRWQIIQPFLRCRRGWMRGSVGACACRSPAPWPLSCRADLALFEYFFLFGPDQDQAIGDTYFSQIAIVSSRYPQSSSATGWEVAENVVNALVPSARQNALGRDN